MPVDQTCLVHLLAINFAQTYTTRRGHNRLTASTLALIYIITSTWPRALFMIVYIRDELVTYQPKARKHILCIYMALINMLPWADGNVLCPGLL